MQAQILQTRTALSNISPRAEAIVIGFRPCIKDLLAVVQRSKALKTIYVAPSYFATVSKSGAGLLAELGVTVKATPMDLRTGRSACWGHRTDKDEFVEIVEDGNYGGN